MPRRLRPEEIELWRKITATIIPRREHRMIMAAKPGALAVKIDPHPSDGAQSLLEAATKKTRIFKAGFSGLNAGVQAEKNRAGVKVNFIDNAPKPHQYGAPFDPKTLRRLRRGRIELEGRIDLHGMRAEQAHHALKTFLRGKSRQGARIVLVVTGKGGVPTDDPFTPRGVLRRQTPLWLQAPDLSDVVSGFSLAHAHHGGDGALYVRLRARGARETRL